MAARVNIRGTAGIVLLGLILTAECASAACSFRPERTAGFPATPLASTSVTPTPEEQAMLVWLKLSDGHFGTPKEREDLRTLEDRLESTIAEHEIGQFDGNEVGDGWYTLYIYGPSTDRLGEVLLPIVQVARPPAGSYAIKRYGPPGAREVRIDL